MTNDYLQVIEEYVKKANGQVHIRLREGQLRESLLGAAFQSGFPQDPDGVVESADSDLEVQLRFDQDASSLSFRITHPAVPQPSECAVATLEEKALEELSQNLAQLCDLARAPRSPRTVIKRKGEPDAYDIVGASSRLKVSQEWLKSVIPCSNYSYDEIDGRKIIREYYWNVELIEYLFRLKNSKIAPEDLKYVADQCCFGDHEWAKDLIGRLKSPNRTEPGPKAQPAKVPPKPNRPFSRERVRHRAKKPA